MLLTCKHENEVVTVQRNTECLSFKDAFISGFPYSDWFISLRADVNPEDSDLQSLRALVRDLSARVEQLERRIEVPPSAAVAPSNMDLRPVEPSVTRIAEPLPPPPPRVSPLFPTSP